MTTLKLSRHMALIVLILLSLVTAIVPSGAGAQGLQTCEDFGSPDVAQTVLEVDPSLAEFLDPDGNGIACDHEDDPAEDRGASPKDDFKVEPSGDGDNYFADIENEVEAVVDSLDRYAEIDSTFGDASESEQQEMIVEIEEIAAFWTDYPDAAAEFKAPAGFEAVEDAWFDFADAVGDTGDAWLIWWETPADDRDAEAAFDDFVNAYDLVWDEAENVLGLIDDAGGSSDPTDEPSGDGNSYVADIQGELDHLVDLVDRFLEISSLGADASDDDVDQLNQIAAEWADYPEIAAAYAAPVDFEVIENAYLDLAEVFGEAGELWEAYWAIPAANDEEEDIALDAFEDAFNDAQNQADEVQRLLGGGGDTCCAIEDPTGDPAGDEGDYLATVQEHTDSLNADLFAFSTGGETITQEEIDRIFENFVEAPKVALGIDVPTGFDEVQDAYEDFTNHLASIPDLYSAWIDSGMSAGMEDPTLDPVFIELVTATVDADELYFTLVAAIEEFEAGAASDTDAPAASDDPYLAYVRETAETLDAELETFLEMMLPTNPSDPETMELILANWFAIPIVYATMALDVPEDFANIHEAFVDYTNELANAAQFYLNWLEAADESARSAAFENLMDSFGRAQEQYVALDAMLTEAGA